MSGRQPHHGGSHNYCGMGNMKLAFINDNTAVYKPIMPPGIGDTDDNNNDSIDQGVTGGGGAGGVSGGSGSGTSSSGFDGLNANVSEPVVKRKRGRPRKNPVPQSNQQKENHVLSSITKFQSTPPTSKKPRGRPPGSGGKHQQRAVNAVETAGSGLTPHVILVKAGEDVLSKIMSFPHSGGHRAFCILSANGVVSNVTLHQASSSTATITHEGFFEILSLSGSFFLSETNGQLHRTGNFNVLLARSDGSILGGGLTGVLRAASSVQIIVASFATEGRHDWKPMSQLNNSSSSPNPVPGSSSAVGSSPSHGTLNESFGEAICPPNNFNSIGS